MRKTAPESFKVRMATSQGSFTVTVHRAWAPQGADRFYNLVRGGYYGDARFFRVIRGFMCQFGIHADPAVSVLWKDATIPDDPVLETNTRGRITFATGGPNTRTTQLFINYNNANASLDRMGFAPFGEVTEGMDVVDKLYAGYGEGAPRGAGPDQGRIQAEGNAYLNSDFPKLDGLRKAELLP
jgi:peptidyl-prolyl cis-trans isomerase A (cyclophilin A)